MSAQRLSAKKIRKIAVATGLELVMAWSHGGYSFNFVTTDHKHGCWDSKSGEWEFYEDQDGSHYSSCRNLTVPLTLEALNGA